MMRAFQITDAETGLEAKQVGIPQPGPGQVLIKVEACGLCHSDTHIVQGKGDAYTAKRPITLGHEVAGVITVVGENVQNLKVGDRIAIALTCHPLADIDWSMFVGLSYDGGYAEYTIGYARHCVPIPDQVSFAQAAVATDSIATAYHAVMTEAQANSSSTIAIVGLGGLGLNGVKIAALQGATVYGVDIDTRKFPLAIQSGARECFTSLEALKDVNIDVVIDFAGTASTTADAVTTVKQGGTVVLVGLDAAELKLPQGPFVMRCIRLHGSIGATLEDLKAVLQLLASGELSSELEEIPFDEIPQGLERLGRGEVIGRLYARPNINC